MLICMIDGIAPFELLILPLLAVGTQHSWVTGTDIDLHPSRVAGAGTDLRVALRMRVCTFLTRE